MRAQKKRKRATIRGTPTPGCLGVLVGSLAYFGLYLIDVRPKRLSDLIGMLFVGAMVGVLFALSSLVFATLAAKKVTITYL